MPSPVDPSTTTGEYCHHARFEALCHRPGDVLVVRRALYGRMKVGGCVRTNFGYVGCYVDVLDVLHGRCTGRRRCTLDVVEPTFGNRRPCNVELNNYLEVDYICLPGESVALLVARRTNDRKVVGSRPTKVVCITELTGNRLG